MWNKVQYSSKGKPSHSFDATLATYRRDAEDKLSYILWKLIMCVLVNRALGKIGWQRKWLSFFPENVDNVARHQNQIESQRCWSRLAFAPLGTSVRRRHQTFGDCGQRGRLRRQNSTNFNNDVTRRTFRTAKRDWMKTFSQFFQLLDTRPKCCRVL